MDLYREEILDHYKHPHNSGDLKQYTHNASRANPVCGDKLTIQLNVEDGVIRNIAFSGVGCAISQASASMVTDEIKGKHVEAVKRMDEEAVQELLGGTFAQSRLKCAMLSVEAVKSALETPQSSP